MIEIELDEDDFQEALDDIQQMYDNIDEKWLKQTLRRKVKPIERSAKINSHSKSLMKVIGTSMSKKNVGDNISARVGVVKNDPNLFPDINAYALASILEYGTVERFREVTNKYGAVVDTQSTGRVSGSNSWLRASYDKNIDKVIRDFESTIEKRAMKGVGE